MTEKNNNYLMGLEYLSSIILLSRCTSLIGGNCGGTMAALFFNDSRYEYTHIFDLGPLPVYLKTPNPENRIHRRE